MTNQQFLDGLAIGSILPAPLTIFSTFVGFVGHGVLGAIAMTGGTPPFFFRIRFPPPHFFFLLQLREFEAHIMVALNSVHKRIILY